MRFRFILLLLLPIHFFLVGNGQTQQDAISLYKDANAYFYFEDYEEALALYLQIYESFPDNHNLDYRIGFCYLSIAGEKTKAIPYLERATQNTTLRYRESSIRETKAPIDAYFYLGNAYAIANRPKHAEEAYLLFRDNIKNEKQYDLNYYNQQLEALETARVLKSYPVNFLRTNLGNRINNHLANFNAVTSFDGKTLAFTTKERFYQSINISKWRDGEWSRAINITLDLVVDGNCSTLSLNSDGTELFLFKDDGHDGNIYNSKFDGVKWSPMKKLNEHINTDSYETHASISADGRTLFFASNRPNGHGDLDIYVSYWDDQTKDWGPAQNLGAKINTPFNENSPFITKDGKTLYFTSDGHNSMGGYDVFFSQLKDDGTWSTPVNLGYPINTTDDEQFYQPVDNGASGLMAIFDTKGYGQTDIVQLDLFLPKYKRGIVSLDEFHARKSAMPETTLIIDTVNVPGVALLDPSHPEHAKYLAQEHHHTLFFDGNPYAIGKHPKVAEQFTEKAPQKALEATDIQSIIDTTTSTFGTDSLLLAHEQSSEDYELDHEYDYQREGAFSLTDTLLSDEKIADKEPGIEQKRDESARRAAFETTPQSVQLYEIISNLAPKGTKQELKDRLNRNWNLPPDLLKVELKRLAEYADSTGQTSELTRLFTRFLDAVSAKKVETTPRQSRQILQANLDEEFFFRLLSLKRKTSLDLTLLLDDALLTQPSISSFLELFDYLNTKRFDEFEPLRVEFLTLIAEEALMVYNALPVTDKEKIHASIVHEHQSVHGIIAISFAAFILLTIILAILRKKSKRKNINAE